MSIEKAPGIGHFSASSTDIEEIVTRLKASLQSERISDLVCDNSAFWKKGVFPPDEKGNVPVVFIGILMPESFLKNGDLDVAHAATFFVSSMLHDVLDGGAEEAARHMSVVSSSTTDKKTCLWCSFRALIGTKTTSVSFAEAKENKVIKGTRISIPLSRTSEEVWGTLIIKLYPHNTAGIESIVEQKNRHNFVAFP